MNRHEVLQQFEYNFVAPDVYEICRLYYQTAVYIVDNIHETDIRTAAILTLLVAKDMTLRAYKSDKIKDN